MRVAALFDVHGNLPALDAVLGEVEREGVRHIVSGGDLVAGPAGAECLNRLRSVAAEVSFVRGNADREVPEFASEVADWPLTVELAVDGLDTVVFCHGTPRSDEEIVTRLSPDDAFDAFTAAVTIVGHTHVQFDRDIAGRRVVNAGSVGRPYEGRRGAFWALLGPDVDLRCTSYDVAAAARELPELAEALLQAPGPEEASTLFESMRGA